MILFCKERILAAIESMLVSLGYSSLKKKQIDIVLDFVLHK